MPNTKSDFELFARRRNHEQGILKVGVASRPGLDPKSFHPSKKFSPKTITSNLAADA
jgi:hypothetical protein